MSVYIDTITFVWAIVILFLYSDRIVKKLSFIRALGLLASATYLLAQSGWTTAFFLGDVWGRDLSNYMWFIFNCTVLALLSYLWYRKK